jgi:hypothetical protein
MVGLEQLAIDVGEPREVLGQPALAGLGLLVQRAEHFFQHRAHVRAVILGVELDEVVEAVLGLKDAGVIGKQAEQQPHQEHFEFFAGVVVPLQRIMELADCDNGLLVDGVGLADVLRPIARNEGEAVDVLG